MKNSDMPASGIPETDWNSCYHGLTKREMFAVAAMQGILSNRYDRYTYEQVAGHAVAQADALLSALEQQK